ncbi:hypothetical protein [Parasphingorhabdus sp.]|uniref:hypothetical protein n=1 Tax=Parasphingorhabdus sp. TaxID=2709688 RepID=UPI003D29FB07
MQFKFASEDCAANHFSTMLKQAFVGPKGGDLRFSIRIDHGYASTHTPTDILDEFETQLARIGIDVKGRFLTTDATILSNNEVAGNMDVSIETMTINHGAHPDRNMLLKRTVAVCDALIKFVEQNGKFMIEFRDCSIGSQTAFWRDIWEPVLAKFEEKGMVFVHMLGPACQQRVHEDAPTPNWTMTLPTGFDSDEARKHDACQDLIDVFSGEGQASDVANASASTLLDSNLDSVGRLHSGLAAVLMGLKARTRMSS